jgi:CHAD domain
MKHLKIEGIIEKRFGKINEAFESARQHFNADDIRIFRVKVKKLAACLNLIDAAKGHGHPVKLPRKVVKLNQLFGAIRTLQMQQVHIQNTIKENQIGSPETYLKFISNQILQHMEDAGKQLKGIRSFKKEEEKLLKSLPGQLNREAILQFVRSEGHILEKLLTPVFPADKSFHEARKHLKNLLYVSPYINLEMSVLSPYKVLSSFEDIDSFTKLLGSFRDLNTALDCLHTAVQKIETDENEKVILRRVEQIWSKAREAYRIQIYDELQKITASGQTAESPVEWLVM